MIKPLCEVLVDLEALRANYCLLRGKAEKLMPVIKADAYGHGIFEVADILCEEGSDHFAVGSVAEGAALRDHLKDRDAFIVCLLGCLDDADFDLCEAKKLVPLVHNPESLCRCRDRFMDIALKVDTGMGRLGFKPSEMGEVARSLVGRAVRPVLLLSHLAVADVPEEGEYTAEQFRRMDMARDAVREYFPEVSVSHGNSCGMLLHPDRAGDIVRPGIILYGGNPLRGTSLEKECAVFKPVMSAYAPILSVHTLEEGESLGYGRLFRAGRPSVVAWVGIGYADCFRRNYVPGTSPVMSVKGRRCPIIGRVAMQMTALDVTDLVAEGIGVNAGDKAEIFGKEIDVHEVAEWWGTIPYEVMCLMGKNRA